MYEDTNDINRLVKELRLGAYAQENRRQAVLRIGELLENEEVIAAGHKMKPMGGGESDFTSFQQLQRREADLWKILNKALDAKGYPPAINLQEAMKDFTKPTPEQIARWFGNDAVAYIRENSASANYGQKCKYAQILAKVGTAEDVPTLKTWLEDEQTAVRQYTIIALGNIGTDNALMPIIQAHDDEKNFKKNFDVPRSIASALGNFDDPKAVEALKHLLEHVDTYTRQEACVSLIALGQTDVVVDMMMSHSDKYFQNSAAEALAKSEHTSETVPHLLNVVKDHPYFMVRLAAIKRLGALQEDAAFEIIADILVNDNYTLRTAAVDALTHYGDRSVDALGTRVNDEDMPEWASKKNKPTVSSLAKQALETIGTDEAITMLERWA